MKLSILLLLALGAAYRLVLNIVQYRSANNPIPENVADVYDAETYAKWRRYSGEHSRLSILTTAVSFLLSAGLLLFNVHAAFASLFGSGIFPQLCSIVILECVVDAVVSAAIGYYETMVIEEKYGFNRSTLKTFVTDRIRNFLLGPFKYFSTFRDPHLPSSYLKSTFREVWQVEGDLLEQTGRDRFRSKSDLTHWLMKCWQICQGRFYPRKASWGRHYELWEDDVDGICRDLEKGRYKAVCINDSKTDVDLEAVSARIRESFEKILPEKSLFEKDR